MNYTFTTIGNFGIKDPHHLFQFFVEHSDEMNPFAIYLPKEQNFFKHNVFCWLKDLVTERQNFNELFCIFRRPLRITDEVSDDTYELILKTMVFFKENTHKVMSNEELEASWSDFKDNYCNFGYNQNYLDFCDFYNFNNYSNYKLFVSDVEGHIAKFYPEIDLAEIIDEILIIELFMKNIGRHHFACISSIHGDNLSIFKDGVFDFEYENPFKSKLFLTTHFNASMKFGNYQITFNWPWCISDEISSNIEKDFQTQDLYEIELNSLLRYSQTYINEKQQNYDLTYRSYTQFYEGLIPIVPYDYQYKNQQSAFLSNQQSSVKEEDYKYSPYYNHLSRKFNVSRKFIDYCLNLHSYIYKLEYYRGNIYESFESLKMPFWEVSRIQIDMYRQHLLAADARESEYRIFMDQQCDNYCNPTESEYDDIVDDIVDKNTHEALEEETLDLRDLYFFDRELPPDPADEYLNYHNPFEF
jgi:hypothetical protein